MSSQKIHRDMVGQAIRKGDVIVYCLDGIDITGTVVSSLEGLMCNDLLVSEIVEHTKNVLVVVPGSVSLGCVHVE